MLESTGIGSYFAHNFMGAESNTSYIAGMNFSNLIIAIPIIATILLLISNFIRSKFTKYIPNRLFECKFIFVLISVTLILYTPIIWIFIYLLEHQLSISIILAISIICHIPFFTLSWCIYNEFCFTQTYIELDGKDIDSYQVKFLTKIKQKIQEIRSAPKVKNILVNGSWGAGKSYFIESHLKQTPSLVYLSCTDYADTHELITALIEKTNNCLFRWLVRLSITRVLAIIGKFELKQFIGINKVIVFDEFERLVDYNKIDPMHIVSLIQYLNNQKICICILVANDVSLNNNSQFTNVREKLISYIYHYKLPFEDAIKIIKDRNNGSNFVDLESIQFSEIRKDLHNRYQIDNNIRMIEHAYIKINQIYSSNKNFIDFKRSDKTIRITEEEFFALLFSNVLDLINPLYYLYLKNPYNLKALEHLATTYQHDTNKKSMNAINNMTKQVTDELMPNPEATLVEKQKEKENYQYFEDSGIQSLALKYINHAAITYESNYSKTYDISYDLNFIMCNQDFENIDIKLITNYLGDKEIVKQLILHSREYEKTSNQNIKIFMRLFKQNFCEDDNPELITDYFKSINVLEQRFLRLGNHDTNSSWDDSIVTDYIAYCKYIDEAWHRNNPNNIRPVPYNRNSYINALIIQYLSDSSPDNSVVNTIKEFYSKENKNDLNSIVNELTAKIINRKKKIKEYIELISQIVKKLLESNQQKEDHLILLSFMCHSYNEIIRYLNHENIKLCNNNMTELLEKNITDENYCDSFFNLLSNFNIAVIKHKRDEKIIGNYIEQTFNLINKIYGSNSIIVLNKLNESFNSIKSFLDKDTIKLCNQNMINLITLDHANKKSFLETLFMHLANLNDDITPESLPDDSFKHLLDNIQDIYNTDELKLNFIERFKNDSKNISRKIIAELKKIR